MSLGKKRKHGREHDVGDYEIGGVLGIGTYGEVRYGRVRSTKQRVAVKIVDVSRMPDETVALITNEVNILKNLEHKHCIRILDVSEKVPYRGTWCNSCACTEFKAEMGRMECGHCFHNMYEHSKSEVRHVLLITQELAVGGELFGLLSHTGPFDEEVARAYFRQLIDGVEYLHSKGIVHRDLKPENLVLDDAFQLKIVDFGLARALDPSAQHWLGSGVGSMPYSAPEVYYCKEFKQLFHEYTGYLGKPADVWSCAVILYVMLDGRPPFVRPLEHSYKLGASTLMQCKHYKRILAGKYSARISKEAQDLLSKMFRPSPDERITIEEIKKHPWFLAKVPQRQRLCQIMEEKSETTWKKQQKDEIWEVLMDMRNEAHESGALALLPSAALASPPMTAAVASPSLPSSPHSFELEPAHETDTHVVGSPLHLDHERITTDRGHSLTQPSVAQPDAGDPFNGADTSVSLLSLQDDEPVYRGIDSLSTSPMRPSTSPPQPQHAVPDSKVDIFSLPVLGLRRNYMRIRTSAPAQTVFDSLATSFSAYGLKQRVNRQRSEVLMSGVYDGAALTGRVRVVAHGEKHLIVDFQKLKGDILAFHTLFKSTVHGLC